MKETQKKNRLVSTVLIGLLLIGLITVFLFFGRYFARYFRSPEELRLLVKNWGVWAPLGIVILQLIQIVFAPLPGNLMAFVGGYALGFWPTIVWLIVGVLAGSAVAFSIARFSGRHLLKMFVRSDALARFDSLIVRRGVFYIFLLLLVPNPLGDWVYYLAGLTRIPLLFFLLLVFIARLPSNILECWVGARAVGFGFREWAILILIALIFTALYLTNQKRIEKLLQRLAEKGHNKNGSGS
ncbi:TVP38/TMEM64 family protein [candidate division WOR-3 bacterium]|nr:TVP38/TMEM64 family protein [candidate division WOR-3 bacterium]